MIYKPEYFKLEELVSPEIYKLRGVKAWELFDPNALKMIDEIREFFGVPVTINNWSFGGQYKYSGFREDEYYKVKGSLSQHRFGRAFDMKFKGISSEKVREIILEYREKGKFKLIGAMEKNVSWLHVDTRQHAEEGIFLF